MEPSFKVIWELRDLGLEMGCSGGVIAISNSSDAKAKMPHGAGAVYHFNLRMDLILLWSPLQGELRHFFSSVIVQIMKSDTRQFQRGIR